MMRYAVFSCAGLGDCLLTLLVSENLRRHQHDVTTFHPFMSQLQTWFPELPIEPIPDQALSSRLKEFDRFIIMYEKSEPMQSVLRHCLSSYRQETIVLNPIATPHTDYPYWEEGKFNGKKPFADNLVTFCRHQLGIADAVKSNGLKLPFDVQQKAKPKQVVIHPTSSRPGKNWPRARFLKLAQAIQRRGYEPVFVVSPQERVDWPEAPAFHNLDAMARCVAESGLMVGNDSGIGHLASCFGIPTLSLFKNERTADFWRPAFAPNIALTPQGWLPNVKGLRWRDRYWYWGISIRHVIRAFDQLCILGNQATPAAAF